MFGPDAINTLVTDHRRKLADIASEERLSGRVRTPRIRRPKNSERAVSPARPAPAPRPAA
jgi:hypothetical protein